MNIRSKLRHEILNLLTIISLISQEKNKTPLAEEQLQFAIEKISLLVKYDDIFLGEIKSSTTVFLSNLVENLLQEYEETIKKNKIKIIVDYPDNSFSVDQKSFFLFLDFLLKNFLVKTKELSLKITKDTFSVFLKHIDTKFFIKKELISCIEDRQISIFELEFQILIEMIVLSGFFFEVEGSNIILKKLKLKN